MGVSIDTGQPKAMCRREEEPRGVAEPGKESLLVCCSCTQGWELTSGQVSSLEGRSQNLEDSLEEHKYLVCQNQVTQPKKSSHLPHFEDNNRDFDNFLFHLKFHLVLQNNLQNKNNEKANICCFINASNLHCSRKSFNSLLSFKMKVGGKVLNWLQLKCFLAPETVEPTGRIHHFGSKPVNILFVLVLLQCFWCLPWAVTLFLMGTWMKMPWCHCKLLTVGSYPRHANRAVLFPSLLC